MARPTLVTAGYSVTFPGFTNVRVKSISVKKNAPSVDTGGVGGDGFKEKIAGLAESAEVTCQFIGLVGYTVPAQGTEGTLAGDVGVGAGHCFVKSRELSFSAGEIVSGTITFKRCKAAS